METFLEILQWAVLIYCVWAITNISAAVQRVLDILIKSIGKEKEQPAKCAMFQPDYNSTSLTKCVICGKEKFEHEN